MIANLMTRGIQLQTIEKYKDLDAQVARLSRFGFGVGDGGLGELDGGNYSGDGRVTGESKAGLGISRSGNIPHTDTATTTPPDQHAPTANGSGTGAADISFVYAHWLSSSEKERVEALEWMDEVEEFELLSRHYCVAWGWRGFGDGEVEGDGGKGRSGGLFERIPKQKPL